jgi:hypothetical protein
MAPTSAAADWSELGKLFYRKRELYQMLWPQMGSLEDEIVACARYGGPIAVVRDDRKLTRLGANQQVRPPTAQDHLSVPPLPWCLRAVLRRVPRVSHHPAWHKRALCVRLLRRSTAVVSTHLCAEAARRTGQAHGAHLQRSRAAAGVVRVGGARAAHRHGLDRRRGAAVRGRARCRAAVQRARRAAGQPVLPRQRGYLPLLPLLPARAPPRWHTERRHPTGRERMGSPNALQTLQAPILRTPWVCFRGAVAAFHTLTFRFPAAR